MIQNLKTGFTDMKLKTSTIILAAALASSCSNEAYFTDTLGVQVTKEENREYSYTDKKAGYWYGTTHQKDLQWYSGWNIAKKRIFADYTLTVGGKPLDRSEAECTVYPDRLVRRWDNAVETFRMTDDLPIIHIDLETDAEVTSIDLDTTLISDSYVADGFKFFIPTEAPDMRVMLSSDGDKGFVLT